MQNLVTTYYAQKYFKGNPDSVSAVKRAARRNFSNSRRRNFGNVVADMFEGADLAGNLKSLKEDLAKVDFYKAATDNSLVPRNDAQYKVAKSKTIGAIQQLTDRWHKPEYTADEYMVLCNGAYLLGIMNLKLTLNNAAKIDKKFMNKYGSGSKNKDINEIVDKAYASVLDQSNRRGNSRDLEKVKEDMHFMFLAGKSLGDEKVSLRNDLRTAFNITTKSQGANSYPANIDTKEDALDQNFARRRAYARRNYGVVTSAIGAVGCKLDGVVNAVASNCRQSTDNYIAFNKCITSHLKGITDKYGNDPKLTKELLNIAEKEILNNLDACKKMIHTVGKNFARQPRNSAFHRYVARRNYNLAAIQAAASGAVNGIRAGNSTGIGKVANLITGAQGAVTGFVNDNVLQKVTNICENMSAQHGNDMKYCTDMIELMKKDIKQQCAIAQQMVNTSANAARKALQ